MSDSPALTLVGEDALCCQLGVSLVAHALPGWRISPLPIEKGGVTRLVADLPRLSQAARHGLPVLCIADSDRDCPVEWMKRWLVVRDRHERFLLRLAVTEAESWLLADHAAMKARFRTPLHQLPQAPDDLVDPKAALLHLVQRHAPAAIRREMVSLDRAGQPLRASGYAVHLKEFTASAWQPERAAGRSPSLRRALNRLRGWPGRAGVG